MKKILSVVLCIIMVLSIFSTIPFAVSAQETDTAKLGEGQVISFDPSGTGWLNVTAVYCYIWPYGGDSFTPWQAKASKMTKVSETEWTYDIVAKTGKSIEEDTPYAVIFSDNNGDQTYDLLFDSTVLGDTAYCKADEILENPADSSKTCQPAYWQNQDETKFGPVKTITSIGNIVGTCIPPTTTPYQMFVDFLKNQLENTQTYSGKSDQAIIDDIAKALDLSEEDIISAIEEAEVSPEWKPSTPQKEQIIMFDPSGTLWDSYDNLYCHIWPLTDDPQSFVPWQSKKSKMTKVSDSEWVYDIFSNTEIPIESGKLYAVIFSCDNGGQTYQLLFDSTVLGDTAYCKADEIFESPADSSKTVKPAYWKGQDPEKFGPIKAIASAGNVIGTCIPSNTTAYKMLVDFLKTSLIYSSENAQEILENIAKELKLTAEEIKNAIEEAKAYSMLGNADKDTEVTILDATCIQKYLAGLIDEKEINLAVCDTDHDEEITVLDATRIQKYLAGLVAEM